MGFMSLLVVASTPILQFLLVGLLGGFLASDHNRNILSADARRDTNKVVFYVFSPALIFASLAKTITFHDIISWWFMPVNIGITFLIGGVLGWVAVKMLRPEQHLEGLVIANCSAGNLGTLLLVIIPAVCHEEGSPFGDPDICNLHSLSYVSMSMALGEVFIWTFTYSLMNKGNDSPTEVGEDEDEASSKMADEGQQETTLPLLDDNRSHTLHRFAETLTSPPTLAALVGFIVGAIPWLKSIVVGASAPLGVVQDSLTLLGNGTTPCLTLILGGNLTKGLRRSAVKPLTVVAIIFIRYLMLPVAGIAVVKAATRLGFLPQDPLYHYVLLIQFALPPAMSIGVIAQLFNIGQEECSVIFLWTYLVAAPLLTLWSTAFMYIL